MRASAWLLACASLIGCAHAPGTPSAAATHTPSQVQGPQIGSEEEYTAARADYEGLDVGDPQRPSRRAALESFLLSEITHSLEGDHLDEAYDHEKDALTLYDANELRGAVDDPRLRDQLGRLQRAFSRRGEHEQVIASLAAEMSLVPDAQRGDVEKQYRVLAGWMRQGGEEDAVDGRERLIEDLENAARLWPSPFVVRELTALYLERQKAPGRPMSRRRPGSGMDLRELMNSQRSSLAGDLAKLYLRVSDLKEAVAQLKRIEGQPGDDSQVRALVEKAAAPTATAQDQVSLVQLFLQQGHDDRDVALRVCVDAARRFPKAIEPRICAGKFALSMATAGSSPRPSLLGLAVKQTESAMHVDPQNIEPYEMLATLYQLRLAQIVSDENMKIPELESQLSKVEQFHADAAKRFPQKKLAPSMADALLEVGRGYYNIGHLTESLTYLDRSLALLPSTQAYEQKAQIKLKKGEGPQAIALFEQAIEVPKPDKGEQMFWRAKIRRELADAQEIAGNSNDAEKTRKAALADWDQLANLGLTPDAMADAGLEKAKIYYQLGDREDSIESFEKAIDAAPDRGQTYADAIAFLIARGELDEALDAYHRALGRNEVTDYLKVYCSLWIVDLARRARAPEDPLATAYLQSTDGAKWYDDLARWATGREPESKLVERADTPARKAEAAFYRAMRAVMENKPDEARGLWKQVLDTDMMAFFEYDMAAYYLKLGAAPSHPVLLKSVTR